MKLKRNNLLFDRWSFLHILWGIVLTLITGPVTAFLVLFILEPIEIFIISPWYIRRFKKLFGYEGLVNSLSDIVMNTLGIILAYYIFLPII